jgi:hypothetical protein
MQEKIELPEDIILAVQQHMKRFAKLNRKIEKKHASLASLREERNNFVLVKPRNFIKTAVDVPVSTPPQ